MVRFKLAAWVVRARPRRVLGLILTTSLLTASLLAAPAEAGRNRSYIIGADPAATYGYRAGRRYDPGYIELDPDKLPVGSSQWWRAMDFWGRGGRPQ